MIVEPYGGPMNDFRAGDFKKNFDEHADAMTHAAIDDLDEVLNGIRDGLLGVLGR